MMNYTKSEFYRVFITKEIYIAAALMTGIVLLLNGALHFFGGSYANTSFSYSNLVASPMAFAVMGMIIPFLFYEGGKRNGNLKNTVAGGISRVKIFAGECVVSLPGLWIGRIFWEKGLLCTLSLGPALYPVSFSWKFSIKILQEYWSGRPCGSFSRKPLCIWPSVSRFFTSRLCGFPIIFWR